MCNKLALAMLLIVGSLSVAVSQATAQTAQVPSNASALLQENSSSRARVVKRGVIPGVIKLTRQNGCVVQNPISTTFLDDGTTLKTPGKVIVFGNSVSRWRNEYKRPWQSKLTDYERGEYKIMILQIGQHPPTYLQTEESEEKLIDPRTSCSTAIHKIYRSNIGLLKPLSSPKPNHLSLSFSEGWEKHFSP